MQLCRKTPASHVAQQSCIQRNSRRVHPKHALKVRDALSGELCKKTILSRFAFCVFRAAVGEPCGAYKLSKEKLFMRRIAILLWSVVLLLTVAASAQESRSEISVQGAGFFTKDASGNGSSYAATESGGILGTYRFHLNRWVSAEAAYGFAQNSQKYSLASEAFRIQSGIHQATGSLVFNLPWRAGSRLNPYVLVGGGTLVFAPRGNASNSLSGAPPQGKGVV